MPMVLLGNHCDDAGRQVKHDMLKKWANARFLPALEVSACTGKNIHNALDAMCVLHRRAASGFPLRTRMRSFSESDSSSAASLSRSKAKVRD